MFDNLLFSALPDQPLCLTPAAQYQLMMQQTGQQILNGLHTEYAATGYPIDLLQGGAHTVALLAAIGGGAVSAGGGGVLAGLETLMQYAMAYGAHYGYQQGLQDGRRW